MEKNHLLDPLEVWKSRFGKETQCKSTRLAGKHSVGIPALGPKGSQRGRLDLEKIGPSWSENDDFIIFWSTRPKDDNFYPFWSRREVYGTSHMGFYRDLGKIRHFFHDFWLKSQKCYGTEE